MEIGGVPKLLSFLAKIISFFLSHNHQKLVVLFKKFAYEAKPSYVLLMFFTISILIVGIFSRIAQEDFQYHSDSFFSVLELHPLSYGFDEDMTYEIYSSTTIVDEDDQDFVPRLVHLELVKGASGSHEDYDPSFSSCWTNQGCQQEGNRRICSQKHLETEDKFL
ncbi:unnamed protein product [Lactuca saligna]|uniref:Uncharacterized protein n=1 Tax=Lactuca saligna TaxID=75948 RepID=A0AA35YSD2_LACSI|nr:unnamed protein product [Lactuca saligna]